LKVKKTIPLPEILCNDVKTQKFQRAIDRPSNKRCDH